MFEFIHKIIAVIFMGSAIYFSFLWAREIFEFTRKVRVQDKVNGARAAFYYSCLSGFCFYLAFEIYFPNLIWLIVLFLFIGYSWMQFIIYKKTIVFLEKRKNSDKV